MITAAVCPYFRAEYVEDLGSRNADVLRDSGKARLVISPDRITPYGTRRHFMVCVLIGSTAKALTVLRKAHEDLLK
jgi:hypothetical protein